MFTAECSQKYGGGCFTVVNKPWVRLSVCGSADTALLHGFYKDCNNCRAAACCWYPPVPGCELHLPDPLILTQVCTAPSCWGLQPRPCAGPGGRSGTAVLGRICLRLIQGAEHRWLLSSARKTSLGSSKPQLLFSYSLIQQTEVFSVGLVCRGCDCHPHRGPRMARFGVVIPAALLPRAANARAPVWERSLHPHPQPLSPLPEQRVPWFSCGWYCCHL